MKQPGFMKNPASSRWYKHDLQKQVTLLQAYIHEMNVHEKNKDKYDDAADAAAKPHRWFGVAYIGWGTWNEDVFFVEAHTPEDAIELFEEEIEKGYFDGHGAVNKRDRSLFDDHPDTILVYEVFETGEYQAQTEITWKKVK